MAAVTIHSDFGTQENKICHYFHCFIIYLPRSDETECMILVFWMLSFKPAFSLSSFAFIKRLFSSSLLSAIRVLSSAYLRLLIFLPANLIPACASSSPALAWCTLHIELNKQGDNTQPWCTYSFPNLEPVHCAMSSSNCCFLTWIQIFQEADKVVWYYHFFKNFLQFVVIHTVKGFSIVNEAEVNVFLEFSFFFYDSALWTSAWHIVSAPWCE